MLVKLAGEEPVGSVQLKRKSELPLLPREKATPSETEYLLVLMSEVTAYDVFANRREQHAMPHWMK